MTLPYSHFIIRANLNLCATTVTSRTFSIQTLHDWVNNAVTSVSKEFLSDCSSALLLIPCNFWRWQKASTFLYAKFHVFFFFFFCASVAFWTVPSICWQLFRLLAAQTLTVNGTSPFFYSFPPPWEMLLNASQPFLPGGCMCEEGGG